MTQRKQLLNLTYTTHMYSVEWNAYMLRYNLDLCYFQQSTSRRLKHNITLIVLRHAEHAALLNQEGHSKQQKHVKVALLQQVLFV